jgi:hypothetical protein
MLQIEDIRRSERNDVLPIPISPYAIVRNTAYLRFPPNGASVAEALQCGEDSASSQRK